MMTDRYTAGRISRSSALIPMVVLAALLLASASPVFAWMDEEPRSFSLAGEAKRQEPVQRKILPAVDPELLLAQDRDRAKKVSGPEPLRFAVANDVSYTLRNSGTWQTVPDGRLWRLRIHSPGAVSHNLGITRFDMTRGAKLWLYSPDHQQVEGPFMNRHRSHQGDLWTPIIAGDEIVVEVFVPSGVRLPAIEIGKANQGYRSFLADDDKAIPGASTAGSCHNNVVCPIASGWSLEISAVGAYTLGGTFTCTGTLLNNPLLKPYFLSANHCGINTGNASSVVVYWNYHSPSCTPTGTGSTTQNQSGATFRASYAPSDFVLIELASNPPTAWNVHYSGWDSTSAAAPSTVAIHHPRGDVKKFSTSNTAAQSVNYLGGLSTSGNHWRANWSSGVTEPGSSGSCLFDTVTKRCIGQLHGGPSSCTAGPSNLWDDYGKFSVSWTGGGTASTRLRDWLDPGSIGITYMDGDPHLSTLDGIRYDFQGAGEYVALRDKDGVEIQARTLPVATSFNPGPDPYDGLATCVSLISAVAANVDGHRVTIQPNLSGFPDPSGLQVRVDGILTPLGSSAVGVGAGRVLKSPVGNGYEVDFPNGTALFVTPLYWSSQSKWYMNLDIYRNPGSDGASGASVAGGRGNGGNADVAGLLAPLAPGSWLPALPNGSSLGAMPATLGQRYVDLYQNFGNAWRVGGGSLFDYAPGDSTATFTIPSWPPMNPPCTLPNAPVAQPLDQLTAESLCADIHDKHLRANCVFDVRVTGEPGFADLFRFTQQIRDGATLTNVRDLKDPTAAQETAVFTATVTPRTTTEGIPGGTVQFLVDGKEMGDPVPLDANGQATWTAVGLAPGERQVTARFIAKKGDVFLDSLSFEETHTVDLK